MKHLKAFLALHAEYEKLNAYTYLEVAYTRQTMFMAFICDKPCNTITGKPEPDRVILAKGQGATPDEACKYALEFFEERKAKWIEDCKLELIRLQELKPENLTEIQHENFLKWARNIAEPGHGMTAPFMMGESPEGAAQEDIAAGV